MRVWFVLVLLLIGSILVSSVSSALPFAANLFSVGTSEQLTIPSPVAEATVTACWWEDHGRNTPVYSIKFYRQGSVVASSPCTVISKCKYGGSAITHSPPQPILSDSVVFAWCWGSGSVGLTSRSYFAQIGSKLSAVKLRDQVVDLGRVYDLINPSLYVPGQTLRIQSSVGEVKVWFATTNSQTTTNQNDHVSACLDDDQNNQCDYEEGQDCLSNGGDWYKKKCCGGGAGRVCGFDSAVDAFCGIRNDDSGEWVPRSNVGAVHEVDQCPGGWLVSDSSAFYGCQTKQEYATNYSIPLFSTKTIISQGMQHKFTCTPSGILECGAPKAFGEENVFNVQQCCTQGTSFNNEGGSACLDGVYIAQGQFAVIPTVLNIQGQLRGCNLLASSPLAQLNDSFTNAQLINQSATCVHAYTAGFGTGINAACSPSGWTESSETQDVMLIAKNISWQATGNTSFWGCCPDTKCWNGTACQPQGSYYRIGEAGFVCRT